MNAEGCTTAGVDDKTQRGAMRVHARGVGQYPSLRLYALPCYAMLRCATSYCSALPAVGAGNHSLARGRYRTDHCCDAHAVQCSAVQCIALQRPQ
jgi:hypothetical protein